MGYTIANALPSGSIEDNFEFLFSDKNEVKTTYTRGHLRTLREYAEKCETVTEMGVDTVSTTWAFLAAKPKRLTSIDIVNTKAPDILNLALELAKKEGVDFTFIQGSTLDIDIEETEMLFIDTEHTYKQLRAELYKHAGKVTKYIAMHDTVMYKEMTPALWDFLDDHPEWKQVYHSDEYCGLTIIERVT